MTLRARACLVAVAVALAATEGRAIEMFTFFGDGSRIGLPSLEVPIEAYPGIPLRSDRLRGQRAARRQALRARQPREVQPASQPGVAIRRAPEAITVPPPLAESP
jgi:hypothetical protein